MAQAEQINSNPMPCMSTSPEAPLNRDERPNAADRFLGQTDQVFESFFERSVDAVWLFDPDAGVFVDCNQSAVELIGAQSKARLIHAKPEDLSAPIQPNGTSSVDRTAEIIALVKQNNGYRFEW